MSESKPNFDYIISSNSQSLPEILKETWSYHELLGFLVWRDFSGRYRQSVLGIGWAIINPFVQMVVFSVIFGGIANLDSNGVPYPILTFTAIVHFFFE